VLFECRYTTLEYPIEFLILTIHHCHFLNLSKYLLFNLKYLIPYKHAKNTKRNNDRPSSEIMRAVCTEHDRFCAKTHLHATVKVRVVSLT